MKKVRIYTDGGCQGNPGPGGWGAILECGEHRKEISGGALATTNNRMELQAAIAALTSLKEPCHVEFFTDSEYLKNGIQSWIRSWKANGWQTSQKKPVKNEDLWRQLDAAVARHQIHWNWVKGHAGNAGNERCDQLAGAEMEKIRGTQTAERLAEEIARFRDQQKQAEQKDLLL